MHQNEKFVQFLTMINSEHNRRRYATPPFKRQLINWGKEDVHGRRP